MACTHWNDEWIADLYGELDPAERDHLHRHLASCPSCRETLAELEASRAALRAHAPAVPAAPRLIGVPLARRRLRPVVTFAAGMAAALVLFVAGTLAAPVLRPTPAAAGGGVTAEFVEAAVADALGEQRRAFDVELAALRETVDRSGPAAVSTAAGTVTGADAVTRRDLEAALATLERRITVSRASDVEFLLGELQATEARAAEWFDDNREALLMVAMRNDPRFNER